MSQRDRGHEENCPIAHWRGQPLEGKTILLYGELGFGDEILAWRFAKSIKDLGARVIVSARPPLFRLACGLAFADAVIRQYSPAPYDLAEMLEYERPPWMPDYVCGLHSVPLYLPLGLVHSTVSTEGLYLYDDAGVLVALADGRYPVPCSGGYLKTEVDAASPGINIGVCWKTGTSDRPWLAKTAMQKSLPLSRLAPLARHGVNLVSLQLEHDDDLGDIMNPMPGVEDFADTARIIAGLDLVVTVDTAVAHLAGALGKPVWNLVRHEAFWPWFFDMDTTCWYDSMTLYRQPAVDDWDEPLNRMFADLDDEIACRLSQTVAHSAVDTRLNGVLHF